MQLFQLLKKSSDQEPYSRPKRNRIVLFGTEDTPCLLYDRTNSMLVVLSLTMMRGMVMARRDVSLASFYGALHCYHAKLNF